MKNKETYEAPQTELKRVELESGFMSASVYETSENTESLDIEDQKVSEDVFDFSEDTWKQ